MGLIVSTVAVAGDKVVMGVAIGVAAEAADGAGVGVGDDDTGVAVPVKGDSDTRVSGDEAVDATEGHLELVVVGEGKVQQDTINLGKRTVGGMRSHNEVETQPGVIE